MQNPHGQHNATNAQPNLGQSGNDTSHSVYGPVQWVADAIPGGVIILNGLFDIDYISTAYYEQLGYATGQININTTAQLLSIIHPEDKDEIFPAIYEAAGRKEDFISLEYRVCNSAGEWLNRKDVVQLKYNEAGSYCYAIISRSNIEAKEQMQDSDTETKNLLQKVAGQLPGVIYQFRMMPGGAVSLPYASPGIKSLFDISYEQVKDDANMLFSKVHADDIASLNQSIQYSFQHLTPWQHECRVNFEDGTMKYILTSSMPEKLPDGSVLWNGFVSDITKKKLAEERLAMAERGFKSMFLENSAMIVLMNPVNKTIVNVNPAASAFYGYSMEEMRGMSANKINQLSEDELAELIKDAIAKKEKYTVVPHRVANGDIKLVEIMSSPIDFGTHKILFSIINDVTEKRKAAKTLTEQAAELKRSNDDLSNFAMLASHDLKEPLRMVTSFLNLLKKRLAPDLDEQKSKYIFYALDGAERMRKQINDLLYYSKVSHNKEAWIKVILNEKLAYTLDLMRPLITASHAKITVHPLPEIRANKTMIHELLANLISNAIKYCGDKKPVIEIGFEDDPDYHRIYVKDNGIGVSPENFESIFRMFQQGRKGGEYVGTGIGLALCRRIVNLHQGEIWVESGEEPGSTFWFTIAKRL